MPFCVVKNPQTCPPPNDSTNPKLPIRLPIVHLPCSTLLHAYTNFLLDLQICSGVLSSCEVYVHERVNRYFPDILTRPNRARGALQLLAFHNTASTP